MEQKVTIIVKFLACFWLLWYAAQYTIEKSLRQNDLDSEKDPRLFTFTFLCTKKRPRSAAVFYGT